MKKIKELKILNNLKIDKVLYNIASETELYDVRWMGLDIGSVTVGVSLSDGLKMIASSYTVIRNKIENEELQFRFEIDITDKVSIVALVSALIIGSSVVSFGPKVFDMPLISLIGYIIAIILSVIGIKKFVLK